MSYEIKQIDITDKNIENELRILIKDAFGMEEQIPEGHLVSNTIINSAKHPTIFLAAIEDGKIIGCNGFISTDFIHDGNIISGYQSCWTATHPQHQGRKIFVSIINEAKRILKESGAGFIYGVPNNNSYPIFIKKLDFKEIPCVSIKIPNIPFVRNLWLQKTSNKESYYNNNTIRPDEKQIAELKRNQVSTLIELKANNSFTWGKILIKEKFGIKFKYFYMGGLELADPKDIYLLLKKIYSLRVHYIQIVSCSTNRYNELFMHWKNPAGINPFIFFELNSGTLKNINLMYGSIDVF